MSVKKENKTEEASQVILKKENYMLMGLGVIVLIIGFLLMTGGASEDPNVFAKEEIYSFRRITLAPIVVLIGFGIQIFAIFRK